MKEKEISFNELINLTPWDVKNYFKIFAEIASFTKIATACSCETFRDMLMLTEEEIAIKRWPRNIQLGKVKERLAMIGLGFRPSNYLRVEWLEELEERYNKWLSKGCIVTKIKKDTCLKGVPVEYKELVAIGAGIKSKEKMSKNSLFDLAIERKLKNKKNILEVDSKQPKISIVKSNEALSSEQINDMAVEEIANLFKTEDTSIIKEMISTEFVENNSRNIKLKVMKFNLPDDEKIEIIDKITRF